MKKKFNSGLLIFIIVIAVTLALASIAIISKTKFNSDSNKSITISVPLGNTQNIKVKKASSKSKEYIAHLKIEGQISSDITPYYNHQWLVSTIKKLKNDNNNLAIALYIDSPGGGVYESDEIYTTLQDYKTSGKKVYVYMGPMAASGGYYISCAADAIYANRNTLTGSIGVICGQSIDCTELFENLGIKYEIVHSGKNKNMGNINEPLSDEQRSILQSISDECYEQFLSIVVSKRKLSYPEARKLCDGRIFTAMQALNNGLIDKIDSWDNMLYDLCIEIEREDCSLKEFKYEYKPNVFEYLTSICGNISNKQAAAKIGIPEKLLNEINNPSMEPQYLYR